MRERERESTRRVFSSIFFSPSQNIFHKYISAIRCGICENKYVAGS